MSKKRVSGLAFEFSCFCSETAPLRISTGKKKKRKSTRDSFSWPSGGNRIKKKMEKEEKSSAKMRLTTKAWKKEPRMPYSVERGGGGPHYKHSVKHVSRLKIKLNKKNVEISNRGIVQIISVIVGSDEGPWARRSEDEEKIEKVKKLHFDASVGEDDRHFVHKSS